LTTLDGLAYSLFGQKKYDDAEIFYKRLLDLWLLIGNLPMIADTNEKIAVFYREQKRWDEGTAAAANAIALRSLVSAVGLSMRRPQNRDDKPHAIEFYRKHSRLPIQIARIMMDCEARSNTFWRIWIPPRQGLRKR
jgi:hypothetical protein